MHCRVEPVRRRVPGSIELAGPPMPALSPEARRLDMAACMRALASGGMLAIICAIESWDMLDTAGGVIPSVFAPADSWVEF